MGELKQEYKMPDFKEIAGVEPQEAVKDKYNKMALIPTEKLNMEALKMGNIFNTRRIFGKKKEELLVELTELSQYLKDHYKYSLDATAIRDTILHLRKAEFIRDNPIEAWFCVKKNYPVFFVEESSLEDTNTLIVAPVIE